MSGRWGSDASVVHLKEAGKYVAMAMDGNSRDWE